MEEKYFIVFVQAKITDRVVNLPLYKKNSKAKNIFVKNKRF